MAVSAQLHSSVTLSQGKEGPVVLYLSPNRTAEVRIRQDMLMKRKISAVAENLTIILVTCVSFCQDLLWRLKHGCKNLVKYMSTSDV